MRFRWNIPEKVRTYIASEAWVSRLFLGFLLGFFRLFFGFSDVLVPGLLALYRTTSSLPGIKAAINMGHRVQTHLLGDLGGEC